MIKKYTILVLITMIVFSTYKITQKLYKYKLDDTTYSEIKNIKDIGQECKEDFNVKLKKENSNYVCWIKVKGTNIDYPVVYCDDNKFYLNHDFYNKDSISGTLFLDYRNTDINDNNLIIYGHNMRNGSMFHDLMNFKNANFIKDNNIITLESSEGTRTYKVFSVYVESGYDDFIKYKFQSKSEKMEYLSSIKNKSMYDIDEKIDKGDDIITLSTCSYEFNEARKIVHGKRID